MLSARRRGCVTTGAYFGHNQQLLYALIGKSQTQNQNFQALIGTSAALFQYETLTGLWGWFVAPSIHVPEVHLRHSTSEFALWLRWQLGRPNATVRHPHDLEAVKNRSQVGSHVVVSRLLFIIF